MAEPYVSAAWNSYNKFKDFDKNMKALKRQVTQLSSQAEDIETTLMNLEQGGKKKRKLEVKGWLEQVEEMKNDFEAFNQRITNGGLVEKVKSLEDVQTMREAVKELKDDGKNIGELTVDVDESIIPSLVVSELSGKTSNDNLEILYGWLEDDKISSIGVYGMGGVGKTTLVKHIHNRILQKMSGVNVYWVTISQDFSIKKLQDDIAKIASLQFLDENEEHRAAILHQHLVGKKTVLILDDVWKCIHLEKLGNPHRIEGCKFIITSRSLEVCRQIECQELFKVNTLNENEAWDLFKENLLLHGHTVLTDAIEKHAKELAKKCGGLPLALNTVAASMRGVNDDHIWRNAINNFQNASLQLEDLEKNVFEILKFSYNRLNNKRLKECFLYCSLYPEDHYIGKDEVIMMLIAEGLCEDTDECHSILNKLVDVFLLEVGEWFVKMHDLMREMALKISKFMVKSELTEIPEEKHWIAELERVSFMRSEIKEIPSGLSPRCPNLSTLILQSYDRDTLQLQRIPESFLSYMTTQLRVLDLSYNRQLTCLPNSISDLENLSGLFLRCCGSISCLPTLEKLSALRVLDISGCSKISCLAAIKKLRALRVLNIEDCKGIRELPQDMECLASLQYLYTMRTSILVIPKVLISKLRNLRCLELEKCESLQSEEVNWLSHLQEFTNCYDELHSFNTLVKKLEQLECYHICVGRRNWIELDTKSRTVYLEGIIFKGERGQEIKALLPANICCLHINRCEGLNGSIADYFQSVMSNPSLRKLEVRDCKEVEWIFNNEQITENAAASSHAFKSLEVLDLTSLPKLISVCKGEDVFLPANCTFSFLKRLSIFECKSIKKLLSQALLQNLKSLETLYVARCYQLEVVIGEVEGDEEGIGSSSNSPLLSPSNILYLPNLKSLQLDDLPALKSICNGREMICRSIEFIGIEECTNVKMMPSFLPINETTGQAYLPSSFQRINLSSNEKEWWESLECHNPNAKHILQSHIHWIN